MIWREDSPIIECIALAFLCLYAAIAAKWPKAEKHLRRFPLSYLPITVIILFLAWCLFWPHEPKTELPEKYANMTEADLPRLQQELFDEARAIREKGEKMDKIWDDFPGPPYKFDDMPEQFFTSRGITKGEFLDEIKRIDRELDEGIGGVVRIRKK